MISASVDKAVDAIWRATPRAAYSVTPSPAAPTPRARPLEVGPGGRIAELLGVMASGQVVGLIEDLPSCAELIERIMAEAETTLKRLA